MAFVYKSWLKLVNKFANRDGFRCFICRQVKTSRLLNLHHIVPRSEGGLDVRRNLLLVCHSCHNTIEDMLWKDIMKMKKRIKEEIKDNKKKKKDNSVSFYCPSTGNLCIVDDPTIKQLKLISKGLLTAMDLI